MSPEGHLYISISISLYLYRDIDISIYISIYRCPPKADSNSSLKHKASRSLSAGLSGALRRAGMQAWKVSTTQRYGALSQSNHPCDPLAVTLRRSGIDCISLGSDLGPMTVVGSRPASPDMIARSKA